MDKVVILTILNLASCRTCRKWERNTWLQWCKGV